MKNRIDRRLRARGQQERHVKLGVGGIRDIEFHIQALQLLYGGQDPWLRERNSLRALHRLAERGYLSWEESGRLAHAYVFLRTVEHRLQILHALQTHTLPADPDELAQARAAPRLRGGPGGRRGRVPPRLRPDAPDGPRRVRGVLRRLRAGRRRRPPPWDAAAVAAVGFADPERARQNLRLLWEGPALVAVPAAVRTALRTLLPATLAALGSVPDPDAALDALERFVATAGPRTAYLARLASTPALLGGMLTFFTRSERLAQTLIARPELLDALGPSAGARAAVRAPPPGGVPRVRRARGGRRRPAAALQAAGGARDRLARPRPRRAAGPGGVGARRAGRGERRHRLGAGRRRDASRPGRAPGRRAARAGARRRHGQARGARARLRVRPRPRRPLRRAARDRPGGARLLRPGRRSPVHDSDRDHAHGPGLPRGPPPAPGREGHGARALPGDARPLPRGGGGPLGAPGARARPPDPRRPGARPAVRGAPPGAGLRPRALGRRARGDPPRPGAHGAELGPGGARDAST